MLICFIIYCIDNLFYPFLPISTLVISYLRTRIFFTISTATRRRNFLIDFNLSILSLRVKFTHNCHPRITAVTQTLHWTHPESITFIVIVLSMGQTTSRAESIQPSNSSNGPISHHTEPTTSSAKCPVSHDPPAKKAECPVDHTALNPSNQMPSLSQTPAPNQTINLPISRTVSSISREQGTKWEYPSPQQFYNALVRKGWETPQEHIETMVDIHNFLNEEAWEEVKKWERRHAK